MGSFTSFGKSIPVLGPNIGFDGSISRLGERVVAARQVYPQATKNLVFGNPAVIIPDSTGGTYDSVAGFIDRDPANAGLVASTFAGAAVREVKTQLVYEAGSTPGIEQVGYYQPGEESEVLERGSQTVPLSGGTPVSQGQVYTRVALNEDDVPGGSIGDWEATPPDSDNIATTGSASSASTALTVASGTGLQAGQVVTGVGIAPGTAIESVSGTAVVLSLPTTASLSTTAVNFSNVVALPFTVFRTGYVDDNSKVEVTFKLRNAA